MTRRDYIIITNILRETRPKFGGLKWGLWANIRDRFARELAKQNPNFDRNVFEVETLKRGNSRCV